MNLSKIGKRAILLATLVAVPIDKGAQANLAFDRFSLPRNITETAATNSHTYGKLNTLRELSSAIRACWTPPSAEQAFQGMQVTVRIALRSDGSLLAEPRVSFLTPAVPEVVRKTYRDSVVTSLTRCAPFPISRALGGAVAGRPLAIRFFESRKTFRSI
jgi:hypothetical protein